ncbi:MAG: ThiF family adenylyltransferase [Nocardiopsaceae bacterium]|nr:ThiF family adenylyltransferase [Nocardiopsaceae bacterium]
MTAVSPAEDRFARQRLIPGWDQRALSESTVALIGVGALGNEVAKNLALAGVGRLILCDPDTVAESNLSRTVLFTPDDVGRPKAEAAAGALARICPDLRAEPRVADLVGGVGLGELADARLVIGCVDTIRARMELLGRCALVGAALIDGGTSPWGAELRVRVSVDEPCFGCSLSPHQRAESDVPWSCAEPLPGGRPDAAAITTTAVAAGWMSAAGLGLIFGQLPPYRMLSLDVPAGRATTVAVRRDPGCPFHRPLAGPVVSVPVGPGATAAEFLATLGDEEEAYTWSGFPMRPRCRRCGSMTADPERSRPEKCPRCGAAIRKSLSTRLRDARPGLTLHELGVAPAEILPVISPDGSSRGHRLREKNTGR